MGKSAEIFNDISSPPKGEQPKLTVGEAAKITKFDKPATTKRSKKPRDASADFQRVAEEDRDFYGKLFTESTDKLCKLGESLVAAMKDTEVESSSDDSDHQKPAPKRGRMNSRGRQGRPKK